MVTKNFKALLGVLLQISSDGTLTGVTPGIDRSGRRAYIAGSTQMSFVTSPVKDSSSAGIVIGRGTTPATEDDYDLEDMITGGVNLTKTEVTRGEDSPGDPWVQFKITVTNTGSEPLTVGEIGYRQHIGAYCIPDNTNRNSDGPILLDRTVLNPPITIAPGDAGIIHYKLKTSPKPARTIGGVEIVSWEFGTDEQIAAMIEAARLGTIDLQTDAGWQVGDVRPVQISAFTGGGNTSHAAQQVGLVISDFSEYENCGNVLQFDFLDTLKNSNRMNNTGTTVGGYGSSEMKTTTLPALVEALPSWLQGLLKTFDVKAGAGNGSSTIETVTGNKLALRSEVEVFGTTTYSAAGEGVQAELYKNAVYRQKYRTSSNPWWERSPNAAGNNSYYCMASSDGSPGAGSAPNYSSGVAPFGCL